MTIKKKWLFNGVCLKGGLISIVVFMFMGCAAAPKEFDPSISGPQLIVEPESIRLGVATLVKGTDIVFRGKGFEPDDSVFVKLLGVEKDDEIVDVPIADAEVDKNGYFTAKVDPKVPLVKVTELLRAKLAQDEDMETIIIIHQPPIPVGVYTARAVSMESDIKADCKFEIQDPSLGDRFKDWIGGLLGKIVYEGE
jgi:hypothetical protein